MNDKKTDRIAESLNMVPIEYDEQREPTPRPDVDDKDTADFDFVRSNYYDLIEKGQDALDELILLAKQSERADTFDSVASLIKTLNDSNKALAELVNKRNRLKDADAPKKDTTINNNTLITTTEDLQKMLEDRGKHKENDD